MGILMPESEVSREMKFEIDAYFEPDIAWVGEINRQTLKLESMTSVFPAATTRLTCSLWRGGDCNHGITLTLTIAGRQLTARAEDSSPVIATRRAFEDLSSKVAALIEERRTEGFWRRTSHDRSATEKVRTKETPTSRSEAAASVDRELGELYNFVRREIAIAQAQGDLNRGDMTVEEIVEEVALMALEDFGERPAGLSFRSWLFQLTLDVIKRKKREIEIERRARTSFEDQNSVGKPVRLQDEIYDFFQPDHYVRLKDLIPDGDLPTPEEALAEREVQQHINQALAQLPRRWREAFVLYSVEGLTLEEVARVTRQPVDATRRAIELARELLRAGLAEAGVKPAEQELRREAVAS